VKAIRPSSFPVFRPSVLAALVYFGLCSIWFIWVLCTYEMPVIAPEAPFHLIDSTQFGILTAIDVLFLLAFAIDGFLARRSPKGLRRTYFAELVLAASILVLIQLCAFRAYGPIQPF